MKLAPLLLAGCFAALSACATKREAVDNAAVAGTAVGEAMAQPLKDLNLVKDPIPSQLRAAMKDPYQKPERADCAWLEHEVRSLDLALGPDVDIPAAKDGMATTAASAVGGAAATAVSGVVSDMIPFRSVVRALTGAEANAQEMRGALKSGDIRRAYLKGLGLERGCAYPAAPAPLPMAKNAVLHPAPPELELPKEVDPVRPLPEDATPLPSPK